MYTIFRIIDLRWVLKTDSSFAAFHFSSYMAFGKVCGYSRLLRMNVNLHHHQKSQTL